jgi:hypothetical protein
VSPLSPKFEVRFAFKNEGVTLQGLHDSSPYRATRLTQARQIHGALRTRAACIA